MPIKFDEFYGVVGPNPNFPIPNKAPVKKDANGCILEVQPPKAVSAGNAPVVGGPSNVPQIALGDIRNTNIMITNQNREHVCDFVLEMQKNIYLKKFLKAVAQKVREGIRAVIRVLGVKDRSGILTEAINELKAFARDLREVQKFLRDINDFQRYVLAYITKIRALIQYILGLPARLAQLVRDCLLRFLKLIANIFTDFLVELGPIDDGGSGQFAELISASREVIDEVGATLREAGTTLALAAAIPASLTVGLLIPVSQEELDAANNIITTYETENPNPTPAQITSAGTNLEEISGMPAANNVNTTIEQNRFVTV
jgi:hypothetical protein